MTRAEQINYQELSPMERFNAKYTYLLIALSLAVSIALQAAWLQQLFMAQQKQLKDDIEHVISITAQTNVYHSMINLKDPGNIRQLKQLFLSPQWEQLRQSFENIKVLCDLSASSSINIDTDSTSVIMSLKLKDNNKKTVWPLFGDVSRRSAKTTSALPC